MTLKRQFQFYLIALVLVPTIVAAILTVGVVAFSTESEVVRRAMDQFHWVEDELKPALVANDSAALRDVDAPEGVHVIVVDPEGMVAFSTVAQAVVGERFVPARPPAGGPGFDDPDLAPPPEDSVSIFIEAVDTEIGVFRIVQAVPSVSRDAFFRRSRRVFVGAVIFFALLFLGAIVGFFSVSSLQRDLLALQRATRRISSGDLEFRIDPPSRGRRRSTGSPNEIDTLALDLDGMRATLLEDQARRSRFLMAVSHDLATPLTTIRGYIEAIEDGLIASPDELRRSLTAVRNKTDLLESRIVELIDFVRLETGEWRMQNEQFSLRAFLEEVAMEFRQDAAVARRSFESRIDLDDRPVTGDRKLLVRVFENLFHNALRFTTEGDRLFLTATPDAHGGVRMQFADTGPGFGEADPSRLVEPLARGSHARNEAGFGLGLSTAATIVRSHGWSIQLSDARDGGAVVEINIPPLGEESK